MHQQYYQLLAQHKAYQLLQNLKKPERVCRKSKKNIEILINLNHQNNHLIKINIKKFYNKNNLPIMNT